MQYIVRPVIPQIKDPLKISEAEYQEITNARKSAWDILVVKEFFSYAVRNFYRLESEIQKIEIEANHNRDKFLEQSFARENTHIFNLLVMNLLTTCRSYLELFMYQSKHDKAKEIFLTKNEIRSILKNIKNEHHDNNIVCMFFWALRNYAQHHSRPITGNPRSIDSGKIRIGLTVNAEKVFKILTKKQLQKLNTSNAIQELRTYIEQNLQDFDQKELQNYPEKINISLLLKDYLILINKIHDEFKKELYSTFQRTKTVLNQKVEYYCQDNSPGSAFEIYKQNEKSQKLEERFDVCLQLINNWEQTIEKYSNLELLDKD